jgi:nitroimidazol reductase NimA-like FMN-containing flavoprotein (pyridoxamine 5'-phosphate oxidase superfamily)
MGLAALPPALVAAHDSGMSSYGLEVLDPEECVSLLATQRIGRVGLATPEPLVLPIQYAMSDGDIVFRTAPGEKLIAAVMGRTVAFEIDDFDVSEMTGWSVVVVGVAEEVTDRTELERLRELDLHPWAGELRDRFVRIRADEVSGRRVDPSP